MIFAIKNIRASRVNLLMNDYAAGIPSPLSFLGLGDSIVRDMDLLPWSAHTIPIFHEVMVSEGRTKPEMSRNERKRAGVPESFVPIEIVEDFVGLVELSLLIDLPGCDSESDLKEVLKNKRIAGGLIQNYDEFEVSAVSKDGSAFRGLRRGYALVRPDKSEQNRLKISTGDEQSLFHIACTLFPIDPELQYGWIIPVAVGYRLLENPSVVPKRSRTRCSTTPHVFVEPVLGIAELISVRNHRLINAPETDFSSLFWSWSDQDNFVLGHSVYKLGINCTN
ncbi:MAG: hypothetical protein OXC62_07430 [Aestuariivita sp.]|nr:hypothetical protein [Aestuariivita sp.]